MIYAPPSREKSKQTVRSPMIDKHGVGGGATTSSINSGAVGGGLASALSHGTNNGDMGEYPMSSGTQQLYGVVNGRKKQITQINNAYGGGNGGGSAAVAIANGNSLKNNTAAKYMSL